VSTDAHCSSGRGAPPASRMPAMLTSGAHATGKPRGLPNAGLPPGKRPSYASETRLPEPWRTSGDVATASCTVRHLLDAETVLSSASHARTYGPRARVRRIANCVGVVVKCLLGHNLDLRYPRAYLDHGIVLHERHLRRLLTGYFQYYHRWRTHRALAMDCPMPRPVQRPEAGLTRDVPEVGGLHHHDERRAA
jgi:hypothetical protein